MGGRHKDSSNYARIIQKKTQKYTMCMIDCNVFKHALSIIICHRQTALAEIDSKIGEFICHMANFDTRVLLSETNTNIPRHRDTHINTDI